MIGVVLCFLSLLVAHGSFEDLSPQTPKWTLRKDTEGIKVYTRSSDDSKLDEFRGEGIVESTKERLVEVLQDADHFQDWVPDCAESKLISLEDDDQLHYLVSSLPFPISNRDIYVHFKYTAGAGWAKVIITGLPDYGPENKRLVRIPYLVGFWHFRQIAPNETHVTYQLHADPGGSIPGWLANSTTVTTPLNTIRNLRQYVR